MLLREQLELSDSDLSKQMKVLADAGYVYPRKRGIGRGGSTWYVITPRGRAAFDAHVTALRSIVENVGSLASDARSP